MIGGAIVWFFASSPLAAQTLSAEEVFVAGRDDKIPRSILGPPEKLGRSTNYTATCPRRKRS